MHVTVSTFNNKNVTLSQGPCNDTGVLGLIFADGIHRHKVSLLSLARADGLMTDGDAQNG